MLRPPPAASVEPMSSPSVTAVVSRARALHTAHPWVTDGLLWAAPVAWLSVNAILRRGWVDNTSTRPPAPHVAVALLTPLPLALPRASRTVCCGRHRPSG